MNQVATTTTLPPGRLFQARTVKAGRFKKVFEPLRFFQEGQILLTPTGFKLIAIDSRQTSLVHLSLSADKFESYFCVENQQVLGIDIEKMHRFIKSINHKDSLCIFYDDFRRDRLGFSFDSEDRADYEEVFLPLKTMPSKIIYDRVEFDQAPPELESAEFQTICKNMMCVGADMIDIRCVDNQLIFEGRNGFAERRTTVMIVGDEPSTGDIVQGRFALKTLNHFAKTAGLSRKVKFCLKNNHPLILEFELSEMGVMRFALTGLEC